MLGRERGVIIIRGRGRSNNKMTTSDNRPMAMERNIGGVIVKPAPVITDEMRKRTEENRKRLHSQFLSACVLPETPLDPNMSWEEYKTEIKNYRLKIEADREQKRKDDMEKEAPLLDNQKLEREKRNKIQKTAMSAQFKKYPLNKKAFESDIKRYSSIYVFTFAYAKLDSPEYKNFVESLNDGSSYKVYFGRSMTLSKTVGLVSRDKKRSKHKELLPGLHAIGNMLAGYDDVGVLLTNKTEDEVHRKFEEYKEYDFLKLGQTPMESLMFKENDILPLPPSTNAVDLYPKLKGLDMPVELSGTSIKLTDAYRVCEDGAHVTKNTDDILRLLEKRMFVYVLLPLCCWSASTGETKYFHLDPPKSR